MEKVRGCIKIFAAYAIVFTMLLSLMAFPNDIYGSDNVNKMVSIKTFNGKYLCAENGGKVVADRKQIGDWETFELIEVSKANADKCNLTALSSDRSISFTWNKPSSTRNIIGYNLYRGKASGAQPSTPVTDFPIEGTSYIDENVEGGIIYYYVLKVVYDDKTLGAASNEVPVLLESRLSLSVKTGENGVSLYWTKPSSKKNIIGYNLYRGTRPGRQSSTPITDFPIEETSYTDENIENNSIYYYVLKAVYSDRTLGVVSNEVAAKSNLNDKIIVLEVGDRYMLVDGQRKEIDPGKGTTMTMKNGRVFLPIKAVIESMGGEVVWDSSDKKASIYLNNNKIYLWIGDKIAKVNGANKESDVAPYISESGRTMLPLRFIVENLGCETDWDGLTERVSIKIK